MKVYVLKFNDNEYIESYDLANRECSIIDDKYNAEHIHSQFSASHLAERFGCSYEEIEVED
jgi:HD superfamily phosphohydrolase YqeK